jgi:hypothetical protein
MMGSRSYERRKARVTEDQVKQWVEEQDYQTLHQIEMDMFKAQMEENAATTLYPAHGRVPTPRPEGVFRGLLVQLNSMVTTTVKNRKASELEYVVKKYEVQFIGLGEIGVNWLLALRKRLLSLLPDLGLRAKSRVSHNVHEKISVHQQGGVGTIVLGELITYYKKGANDFLSLGRWMSFLLQSVQGHRMQVVQAYAVRPERVKRWVQCISSISAICSTMALTMLVPEIYLSRTYCGNCRSGWR